MKKTYISYLDVKKRNQIEYKEKTPLLDDNGKLLVKGGYAKKNIFDYQRDKARPKNRKKEWDFYQISNGKYMVQVSVANISIGGYISTVLVDISGKEKLTISSMKMFLGQNKNVILPENGDKDNEFECLLGKYYFKEQTKGNRRTIRFKGYYKKEEIDVYFEMDLFDKHENISIVTPFKQKDNCFFLTMKQNSMPASGFFKVGDKQFDFSKDDTFCVLDWGRGVWPYKSVWYWGNGSTYLYDKDGNKHIFGFEITWGIGDESNATETCLFYDGKAHKIGSVDVKAFPKPDKYLDKWEFISEDNRFNLTMTPVYDHHSDLNILYLLRMNSHQVHGLWNGTVTLDDGTVLEIKDMYAFCEYVENRW